MFVDTPVDHDHAVGMSEGPGGNFSGGSVGKFLAVCADAFPNKYFSSFSIFLKQFLQITRDSIWRVLGVGVNKELARAEFAVD